MSDKLLTIVVSAFLLVHIHPLCAQESHGSVDIFTSKAIWNPPDDLPRKIADKCASSRSDSCIASKMRKAGASSDAVKVMELFKGESYLSKLREFGQVDLANVSTFSYNNDAELDDQEILVNGTPKIIYPANEIQGIDIRKDHLYPILVRKFPNVGLGTRYSFDVAHKLPNGAQSFVFDFLLMNGCRGCEVAGNAKISFAFDTSGRFIKTELLGLEKSK